MRVLPDVREVIRRSAAVRFGEKLQILHYLKLGDVLRDCEREGSSGERHLPEREETLWNVWVFRISEKGNGRLMKYRGSYRRDREEAGEDTREGKEQWLDEEESKEEFLVGEEASGRSGERNAARGLILGRPSPVMLALFGVLLLAGCTLGLVIFQMRGSSRQQEEQRRKEEEMARQLEEIQLYLSSVDETLAGGSLSGEESYEELSVKVGSLQKNLTEYRDNNAITDDAIGADLDGVIAQLDTIQGNLEEEKEAAARRAREGISGNEQNTKELQNSVDAQLTSVREDIRRLIQEASGENKAGYQELLKVLDGTDLELASLEKEIAQGQEKVQSTLSTGLGNINGSVSGLKGTLTGLKETSDAVKGQQTEAFARQESLLAGLETQGKEEKTVLENLTSSLAEQKKDLLERLGGTEDNLKKQQEKGQEELQKRSDSLQEAAGELQKKSDAIQEGTDALQKKAAALSEETAAVKETLQSMETALKEHGETMKSMETRLEELTGKKPEAGHLHMDWDGKETTEEIAPKEGGCYHTPVPKLDENGTPLRDENGEEILIGYRASCGKKAETR